VAGGRPLGWRTFNPLDFWALEIAQPRTHIAGWHKIVPNSNGAFRMPGTPFPKPYAVPKPIWVSVPDACFAGGFGRTRCYELIANGLLVSIKLGRKRLISFASIEGLSNAP